MEISIITNWLEGGPVPVLTSSIRKLPQYSVQTKITPLTHTHTHNADTLTGLICPKLQKRQGQACPLVSKVQSGKNNLRFKMLSWFDFWINGLQRHFAKAAWREKLTAFDHSGDADWACMSGLLRKVLTKQARNSKNTCFIHFCSA